MRTETLRSDATVYLTMAILSAVIIFLGFAPSFYLKSVIHAPPPLSLLTIVHGVVFTAWILLFLAQVALISADNVALHRQLGVAGAVLFGMIVSLGYSTAITAGRLGHVPPGVPPPLQFMALPLLGITATLVLFVLALLNRRRSAWHKRLMLAALFTFTVPATHRLMIMAGLAPEATWIALGIAEALVALTMLLDYRAHGRVHPAYWLAAAIFAVLHLGVVWGYSSPVWLSIARTITQS